MCAIHGITAAAAAPPVVAVVADVVVVVVLAVVVFEARRHITAIPAIKPVILRHIVLPWQPPPPTPRTPSVPLIPATHFTLLCPRLRRRHHRGLARLRPWPKPKRIAPPHADLVRDAGSQHFAVPERVN